MIASSLRLRSTSGSSVESPGVTSSAKTMGWLGTFLMCTTGVPDSTAM